MLRSIFDLHLRAAAFCLALFTLLNFFGGLLAPSLDGNEWWIMFPQSIEPVLKFLLLPFAVCLAGFALAPRMNAVRRRSTQVLFFIFALVCLWNTSIFTVLNSSRQIHSGVPLPLSAVLAAFLFLCAYAANKPAQTNAARYHWLRFAFAAGACSTIFALLQMFCFGKTDYRRSADAIVVFGARAYADGRPSDALADRLRTACDLYKGGYASKLIFSGGPGDGAIHETEAMKNFAVREGVAVDDIILDPAGVNTRATVQNTQSLFAAHHIDRVLCVSHFYHLPRVKLAYQRAGVTVYTVPAEESYFLGRLPIFMAREVAALGKYYCDVF
jgi:uncharacterized SAM-binding protein YcdF (DUF218 family)